MNSTFPTLLAATFLASAFSLNTAKAASLHLAIQPTLNSGSDPNGLTGSIWFFEFEITQTTYQAIGTFSDTGFTADSATITVSGAGNPALNTTHNISTTASPNNFSFVPNFFGNTFLAMELPGNTVSSFSFGGVSVTDFTIGGPSLANPSVGDPIDLTIFEGVNYSNIQGNIDGSSFTYNAVTIPEPSSLVLLGCAFLGLTARRRK